MKQEVITEIESTVSYIESSPVVRSPSNTDILLCVLFI